MSIGANKKFSTANKSRIKLDEMPRSQLRQFMEERITDSGEEGKLSKADVANRSGLTRGYIGELINGVKNPFGIGAETILKLAKGFGEDPVLVFRAIIGRLEKGVKNEWEQRVFDRYKSLTPDEQAQLAFQWKNLRNNIDEIIRNRKD